MCYQSILNFFKSIDPIISVIVSPLILFFAIIIPKRVTTMKMIADLLKEFRSSQMGTAISKLNKFYESYVNNQNEFIKKYQEENKELDDSRRLVSQFYQQLANLRFLFFSRLFAKRIINKTWSKNDLQIITTIIIPLEKRIPGYSEMTIKNLQVSMLITTQAIF